MLPRPRPSHVIVTKDNIWRLATYLTIKTSEVKYKTRTSSVLHVGAPNRARYHTVTLLLLQHNRMLPLTIPLTAELNIYTRAR